jgi:predicted small metal-binding protein
MKKLTCRDVGVDCDVEFVGETDDDVMQQASEHAAREHNLPEVPPLIAEKCRAAIRDID